MIVSILCFLIGIISAQGLAMLPSWRQLALLALLTVGLIWLRYWRLTLFVMGALWSIFFAMLAMSDTLPQDLEGRDVEIQGYVDSLPAVKPRRTTFDFIVQLARPDIPRKIRLSWYYPEQRIKAGQHWRLTVRLRKPRGRFNPGTFDYELWLFSRGIGAVGYVRDNPKPVLSSQGNNSWLSWRQGIADRIDRLLVDSSTSALIKALTIGDRSALGAEQWRVFRKTGTVHLIAISGLHIGLVAGLAYWLALKVWAFTGILSFSPQKAAVICAMSMAFAYAALAGFALPTKRALIMLSVGLLALYWQRHVVVSRTIAWAMLALLVVDPLAALSASFWLSCSAVLLILYTLSARLKRRGYWFSLLKVDCVTALGLAPLILFYFQQVSLIAVLANLLAVPVISFLVAPLCLLAILLLSIKPDLAAGIFWLTDWVLDYLWRFLSACADWPWASFSMAQPSWYALLLACLGVLLLLAPIGFPCRYLAAAFFLPIVFVDFDRPANGEIRLTLLDVGQGLATLVETRHHSLVFDSGAKFSEDFDMGRAVVLPYLRYRGIDAIDLLLISHGDNDHIGGAESILATLPVGQLVSDVPELKNKYRRADCVVNKRWRWDGVNFRVLSPPQQGYFAGDNDNSCVLKITTEQQTFLLTGDIERSAETWLLDTYRDDLTSQVLIAPHHGSNTSSSLAFLQQVDPEVVLIPAGYRNRFSFPHSQVLRRYQQLDITWMNIADEGAIIAISEGRKLSLLSSREMYKHYWFNR